MTDQHEKKTYYTTSTSLPELIESIRVHMKNDGILDFELIKFEVRAGLPKCDYGQTVELEYIKKVATSFPSYEDRYKDQILIGS